MGGRLEGLKLGADLPAMGAKSYWRFSRVIKSSEFTPNMRIHVCSLKYTDFSAR